MSAHRWEPVTTTDGPVACHGHCNLVALSLAALTAVDHDAALDRVDPLGHGRRLCGLLGVDPVIPGGDV